MNKMLSTLKSLKHESIHPNFKETIQKKLGVATTKMEYQYTLVGYEMLTRRSGTGNSNSTHTLPLNTLRRSPSGYPHNVCICKLSRTDK
jgi:hypothetical protein